MAGTQITPAGISGLDQINNAFSSIHGMFANPSSGGSVTGGGSGMFGMSPQPISGADNSVTAAQRTASNIFGQMAPSAFSMGTGLLGTGTGVVQTGLDTLQPSIDFFTKLLSGDPSTTTQALAPTAANIAAITSGATDAASRGMPGGGYRASTLAGLPFAEAAQVGNAALGLQPAAATALGQLGGEQAQIGTALGGMGVNLTGQGLSGIAALYNALLQKQNINQQSTPLTAFDQFASGIGKLAAPVGGILTGIGNLGFGGGGGGGGYDAGYLASSPGGGG